MRTRTSRPTLSLCAESSMTASLIRRVPISYCPTCHLDKGEATRVTADDHNIVVVYRCPTCNHAWSRTHPDPDSPSTM
jgi:rubredoxin